MNTTNETKPILVMTGWRAAQACGYIRRRSEATRLGLPATERATGDCLLAVMQLEAMR